MPCDICCDAGFVFSASNLFIHLLNASMNIYDEVKSICDGVSFQKAHIQARKKNKTKKNKNCLRFLVYILFEWQAILLSNDVH